MIRTKKLTPAILLACLPLFAPLPRTTQAQTRGVAPAVASNVAPSSNVYRVGERLSYNVSFSNFATAAHAELLVAGRGQYFGREGVELRAHVETTGIVSAALYSISNDYVTHVDPLTGSPFRIERFIREGFFEADFPAGLAAPGAALPSPPGQIVNPFPGAYDFLSALYYARTLPLVTGASYRIPVQNVSVPYDVELKVVGRELLKTNVGSSNAIETHVRVHGNREANDYRVKIYFTDDEQRIPLVITARHRAGEIRAELAASEILSAVPATGTGSEPFVQTQTDVTQVTPPTGAATQPVAPSGAASQPRAGADSPAVGPLVELPFKVGEQLNFNFYIGNNAQPIGAANFHVRARSRYFNQEGFLFTTQWQTTGAGQTLFPVNNQISSYVDANAVLPFRTELRLREGARATDFIVSIDQNLGNALFADGARVSIPAGTHDLLSVFYALRSFDFTPGRATRVSLLVNKRPRLLTVTPLRAGVVELGGQRIPAVELSLATNDPEGDRFSLRLWVSADKRRLPLRLTAQTPLGPIRGDLAIIPVTLQ